MTSAEHDLAGGTEHPEEQSSLPRSSRGTERSKVGPPALRREDTGSSGVPWPHWRSLFKPAVDQRTQEPWEGERGWRWLFHTLSLRGHQGGASLSPLPPATLRHPQKSHLFPRRAQPPAKPGDPTAHSPPLSRQAQGGLPWMCPVSREAQP